jgi:hypothetical protein
MLVIQIMVQVFCMSGESLILYVLPELLSYLLYSTYKTYSLCYFFYVILENIVMKVSVYRLVLLPRIREALL